MFSAPLTEISKNALSTECLQAVSPSRCVGQAMKGTLPEGATASFELELIEALGYQWVVTSGGGMEMSRLRFSMAKVERDVKPGTILRMFG